MIEGSSIDAGVIAQLQAAAAKRRCVMVCLDSNHTHAHALAELEADAPLTSPGSYCVVFDTIIEDLAAGTHPDRPWGPGDNSGTAVAGYLRTHDGLSVDHDIDHKLLISVAPGGYLRRVR